jgi:membrane-associated protease RseP (regulator of RpoE activity)
MGGLTHGEGRLTPVESIAVSLAGPFTALFLLGLPALWLEKNGSISGADARAILSQVIWINVGWSVLNLLPIPLLDGGHLMYYLIEIAKGKPVSERVMELGQRVGLALLLVMMAFAFYNDLNRLLTG